MITLINSMNFFISISLSVVLLFQGINFGLPDLLNAGELIEHARFHSENHGDNFIVFISKHYGELKEQHEQQHQEEKKEHEKLPVRGEFSFSSTWFAPNNEAELLLKVPVITTTSSLFFYKETYSSIRATAIFQPPRRA